MSDDIAGSKKAVHVKWAGKTIALGTFPSAEADEKCARAKALTRAWRSTMRPKPTREWVMQELERLGVRIVSGKLGRKADDDDERGDGMGGMNAGNFAQGPGMDGMGGADSMGQNRRGSGMGMGPSASALAAGGGTLGGMPPASAGGQVNQHYEMLKLHHMNLLQELHETTMMMNMYQQQQLQQEQVRMQQNQGSDNPANMMAQRQGSLGGGSVVDSMFGSGMGQRGSLGLGMGPRGSLGLGTMGGSFGQRGSLGMDAGAMKLQMDNRIGGGQMKEGGKGNGNNMMMAGLKRTPDNMGDNGMKRQKLDSPEDDD
eukprot:Nitzschia sp. Nitz4//scaffold57_size113557//11904//12928//NITZ4_003981-RA/size113557-augustus-gene-0.168-mRNA-1//1//CDS//3329554816//2609//frame0